MRKKMLKDFINVLRSLFVYFLYKKKMVSELAGDLKNEAVKFSTEVSVLQFNYVVRILGHFQRKDALFMKNSYSRKALITSFLASCTFVTANATPAPVPNHALVTVPTMSSKYEINASILWLQPTSTSLDYGIHTQPLPAYNPNWVIHTINPDYTAAFDVGIGYVFPQSANDIQLKWAHLTQSKSGFDSGASPENFIGPFFQIGPNEQSVNAVDGYSKFKYDLINLDVGQFVDFGCRMQTRFFTGVSSITIKQHLTSVFASDSDSSFSMSLDNISKYSGVGPRFGLASSYLFTPKFGLIAQFAGSAYIGRMRASLDTLGTSSLLVDEFGVSSNPQSINTDNATRLVPALDGKLGLNYCFSFNHDSLFKLEAGYQFATYFNAIREVYPSTLAELGGLIVPFQSGGIFVGTMGQSQSNFAVAGPYLKASIAL